MQIQWDKIARSKGLLKRSRVILVSLHLELDIIIKMLHIFGFKNKYLTHKNKNISLVSILKKLFDLDWTGKINVNCIDNLKKTFLHIMSYFGLTEDAFKIYTKFKKHFGFNTEMKNKEGTSLQVIKIIYLTPINNFCINIRINIWEKKTNDLNLRVTSLMKFSYSDEILI